MLHSDAPAKNLHCLLDTQRLDAAPHPLTVEQSSRHSLMPTMPGRLFFMRQLAGPLEPDAH